MSQATLRMLAAFAAGLALACGGEPERPNVVLFVIDTLRADWLHVYGRPEPTSPVIDALARRGVVFEEASAPAPWTLPSVVSLLTSRLPPEHGVVVDGQRVAPGFATLAERLGAEGYATASFFRNPYAGPLSGLDRGFETSRRTPGQVGGDVVRDWLARLDRRPFFLYIHNTEPREHYHAGERFVRKFGGVASQDRKQVLQLNNRLRTLTRLDWINDRPPGTTDNTADQKHVLEQLDRIRPHVEVLYSGAVREAESRLGEVVGALQAAGVWENTLFVLLSDHGEEMGEHGGWQHDQSLYQELIHVPLVMRFPDDAHAGTRVSTPVSLLDVLPTILEAVGGSDRIGDVRGRSLLPLLEEPAAVDGDDTRIAAVRHNLKKYYRPFAEERGDLNVAVRRGRWKAIWNVEPDRVELYDLEADPAETNDLRAARPELALTLRAFAEQRLKELRLGVSAPDLAVELDPRDRTRLEELGYLERSAEPGGP